MSSERRFRVMGSDAHVIVAGGHGLLAERAEARLRDLEGRWSRFRTDSEISALNAADGGWVRVSPSTLALLQRAALAWRRTDGRFDPSRLRDVVAAGYGTSFGAGPGPQAAPVPATATDAVSWGPDQLQLSFVDGRARIPAGAAFDPGGIGKGFAADLVVDDLLAEGAGGACVNVGGDVRVAGVAPDGGPWIVTVEDPRPDGGHVLALSVHDGAVATSGRWRRRWTNPDGTEAHHLIDPDTGAPAATDVLTATAVAAEGWQAETLATAAFLDGPDAFGARLADAGATGLVVTTDRVVYAPGLGRFVSVPGPLDQTTRPPIQV